MFATIPRDDFLEYLDSPAQGESHGIADCLRYPVVHVLLCLKSPDLVSLFLWLFCVIII